MIKSFVIELSEDDLKDKEKMNDTFEMMNNWQEEMIKYQEIFAYPAIRMFLDEMAAKSKFYYSQSDGGIR